MQLEVEENQRNLFQIILKYSLSIFYILKAVKTESECLLLVIIPLSCYNLIISPSVKLFASLKRRLISLPLPLLSMPTKVFRMTYEHLKVDDAVCAEKSIGLTSMGIATGRRCDTLDQPRQQQMLRGSRYLYQFELQFAVWPQSLTPCYATCYLSNLDDSRFSVLLHYFILS